MERITFTTKVLGVAAAYRLEQEQITQTLRSRDSSITRAILSGKARVGDQLHIILDDRLIGMAQLFICDRVSWTALNIDDAHRGGFDCLPGLGLALKRAGYRFRDLDGYSFYRIQFQWLVEPELKVLSEKEMKEVIKENLPLLDDIQQAPKLLFKVAQAQRDKDQRDKDQKQI